MSSHPVRRRDFVRGAASAALAAPWLISRTSLGDDKKSPASDRLTLGFIGVGHIAGAFEDQESRTISLGSDSPWVRVYSIDEARTPRTRGNERR